MSLVSVVMNCHNGELYLRDSLNSLLKQSYSNWELIFLDNNSTDNTKKIFKSFKDKRFRYFYLNKKEPLGIARFKSLKKAKGKYICFLDSDDIFLTEKIYKQVKILKNSNAGFSITNSIFFKEKKEKFLYKKKLTFPKNVFYELIKNYFISFDTVMIKKTYLKKLDHAFDKNFNIIHDCDLLIRLSKISKMEYIPEALSKWRIHKNGESFKKFSKINNEKINLIKKFDKYYIKDTSYLVSRSFFLDSIYRNQILNQLLNNQSIFFFKDISKLKFNIKNFFLILLFFIPFRNFFINKILSIKIN
jgi:glycosyltransferase involved in cell wall biosynthesis